MNIEENNNIEPEGENPVTPPANSTQITLSTEMLKKIGVGAAAAVILIGGIFLLTSMKSDNRFNSAMSNCDVIDASGFTLAEDNQSLVFDGSGKSDYFGGDFSDLVCVLNELKAPATVESRMLSTNSLMGVQNAEWDGISVSWSYHPDNGLDANLEIQK
ncbi:hypothetical protein MCEJIRE27_00510 [Candidatus Nanopelagicaceae bacterium]